MPVLTILEHPDPRLRQPSAPVDVFDTEVAQLADDLLETLYATSGIGLSAPQTGAHRRVLVMDLSGNATDPQVFVNPEILSRAAFGIVEESCLSVPGVTGNVWRATKIKIRAQDRTGQAIERDLDGMQAVCLQHEVDHLDGKLFIDRLWFFRRLMLRLKTARRAKAA